MPFLLGVVYLTFFLRGLPFPEVWLQVLVYTGQIILMASFGYFLNDCFDIGADAQVGKTNFSSKFDPVPRAMLLIALWAAAYLPWYFTRLSSMAYILLTLHCILLLLYSIPPIRLKDSGLLALVVDAAYSIVIPVFFTVAVFYENFKVAVAVILFVWCLLVGLRNILKHHLEDAMNDQVSGTFNASNLLGTVKARSLANCILLPIELLLFFYLFFLSTGLIILPLIGFGLFIALEILMNFRKSDFLLSKLFSSNFSSVNSFYEYIIPSLLLILLVIEVDVYYLYLLLFHNLIFFNRLIFGYAALVLRVFNNFVRQIY